MLCNKGDAQNPDVRARLVACEVNHGTKDASFFASTPPLEAKRMLFAKYADSPTVDGVPMRLSFIDIRKAYFNGIPKRNIHMTLPREMGLPRHVVAKQVRCVYGTRDAGAIWEDTYRCALEDCGFLSGQASPCIFHHPDRKITCVVHGDDFTSLGSDKELDWLEKQLAANFELKIRGRLGVGCPGENEIRILNRILRLTPEGLEYEADPRHVDLISTSLELTSANSVVTPDVKNPEPELEAQKDSKDVDIRPEGKESEPQNLLDMLCAISENKKSVRFDDDNVACFDICALQRGLRLASPIKGGHKQWMEAR